MIRLRVRTAVLLATLVTAAVRPLGAQTLAQLAARGSCSTAGTEPVSSQLMRAQLCLDPAMYVVVVPHGGVVLNGSNVRPLMSATARDALWQAADRQVLVVNSMLRTVAEQFVLYESGGFQLAAAPGASNHQSGRAVDLENYSAARSAMESAGCAWLGASDVVHFDCPGPDGRPTSVRAFQRLWNVNHPMDRIDEDGVYGPITRDRLARTPAAGFATEVCGVGDGGVDGGSPDGAAAAGADGAESGAPATDAGPPGDAEPETSDGIDAPDADDGVGPVSEPPIDGGRRVPGAAACTCTVPRGSGASGRWVPAASTLITFAAFRSRSRRRCVARDASGAACEEAGVRRRAPPSSP